MGRSSRGREDSCIAGSELLLAENGTGLKSAYVKTCLVCQQDKTERKKEAGLLQPLPIQEQPWRSVSMD